jgi:hypothetical protein
MLRSSDNEVSRNWTSPENQILGRIRQEAIFAPVGSQAHP